MGITQIVVLHNNALIIFADLLTIQHDIACATYRSKLDMSEAYKQIRVRPEDVPKTAFAIR